MKLSKVNYHPGKLTRLLRKLVWYFLVYLPPERAVTITTRNGVLAFNSKDKTTGRNLYIHRHHEFDEMMLYVKLLRDEGFLTNTCEGTVLDVGGYIGMSSCAFLLENIFKKAVAFEPSPTNYPLLKKNIDNNALGERLMAHNMALSESDGLLEFELSEKNYGDHRIRNSDGVVQGFFGEQNRKVIQVPARRFDTLSEEEVGVALSDIRLIWMDIQGHEAKFLRGAKLFLKEHPKVPVIMEFWPYAIKRSGVSREEFIELVTGLFAGYFEISNNVFHYHGIDEIGTFFDEQDDPQKGSTVVLVNR